MYFTIEILNDKLRCLQNNNQHVIPDMNQLSFVFYTALGLSGPEAKKIALELLDLFIIDLKKQEKPLFAPDAVEHTINWLKQFSDSDSSPSEYLIGILESEIANIEYQNELMSVPDKSANKVFALGFVLGFTTGVMLTSLAVKK